MIIFPITLGIVGALFLFQLLVFFREHRRRSVRMVIVGLIVLLSIGGCIIFAWRASLFKEIAFQRILLPYPDARMDLFQTPVFSDKEYWTYRTSASPDAVFTWYRSRAKHADWTIEDQGVPNSRVFVIVLVPREVIFVVLEEREGKTTITYTKEGSLLNIPGVF